MQANESVGRKIRQTLRLKRALLLVWQVAPGWTLASGMLLFVQGMLPLVALYLMKLVVDTVTSGTASPDKAAALGKATLLIGLAAAIALAIALSRAISELIGELEGQVIEDHISDILHTKSLEVDLEYYENPLYYDTLHRAQQQATFRPMSVVNSLVQIGQSGLSLLAMVGLLVSFHWAAAAILFVAAVPGVLVRLRYSGKLFRWQREQTSAERRASYFHCILTDGGYAKEVRLFDLGALFMQWFRDLHKKLRWQRLGITAKRSLADLLSQAGATIAIFGTYLFIAYRAIQGAITLGDMVMYFGAFQSGLNFLRQLLSSLASLYEENMFLANFYEFLDLKPKITEPANPKAVPRPMKNGIVFDHVSFQYPARNTRILEDISMSIGQGQVVALVGENGSGKTTLVKLLCRLYDPTSGSITIDGIDLRQFQTAPLRREISVIFQDYALYSLTARENIWLGNIAISPDDARIIEAARTSGADPVISALPNGYETELGHWFEDGQELSIGEWQKVALARAFLRNAQLIVLDEPTSSMDAKAEYEVFQKFRQLVEGRSALIISHRFSTVRMADYIYVLGDGRIIESGTHAELVRRGGKYAHLFEMQAQHYR